MTPPFPRKTHLKSKGTSVRIALHANGVPQRGSAGCNCERQQNRHPEERKLTQLTVVQTFLK